MFAAAFVCSVAGAQLDDGTSTRSAPDSARSLAVAAAVDDTYNSFVTDPGCAGCSAGFVGAELEARIQGGANSLDTAYGLQDFGGTSGLSGRTWTRDVVRLASGQTVSQNLAVFEVRDAADALVYELYLASNRTIRLWSPAGGLRASSINVNTGIVLPNDGTTTRRIEVSALRNASVIVRVDGVDRLTVTGLSGSSTGNQRYLRAGIDHYDATTTAETVRVYHSGVNIGQADWLGAVGPPPPVAPENISPPTTTGSAQDGQTLTATNGIWSGTTPMTFAYQWRRCNSGGGACGDIPTAMAQTYGLSAADVGSTLRVVVTAANTAGSGPPVTSAQTPVVAPAPTPPANVSPPTISGVAQQGEILTAANGAWSGSTPMSFAHQWLRCDTSGDNCQQIASATAQTYLLLAADADSRIRVAVTATNSADSASATSAPTAVVIPPPPPDPPENLSLPTISGTPQQGQTLSSSNGTWSGTTPMTFTRQWSRCDSGGGTCAPIVGATGQVYVATAADVSLTLRVAVTATNAGGDDTASSNPSAIVAPPAPTAAYVFVRNEVSQQQFPQVTHSSTAGDIDNDGSLDLVSAGTSYLVWFENPGWTPHLVASGDYGIGSALRVRDVNGDGRRDIIVGENFNPRRMVWFEQTPTGGWVKHILAGGNICHDVSFGDLNLDGRVDIACTDPWNDRVVWFAAPTDPTAAWPVGTIDPVRAAWGSQVADVDQDGRLDVFAGRAWYRNTGASPWPRFPYTTMTNPAVRSTSPGPTFFNDFEKILVLDLNGDGRLDVFAALFGASPEGRVYAFLAPPDPLTGTWTPVEIDAGPLFSVHSVTAADFDGSGRIQVAVGEMQVGGWSFGPNPDPQIYLYRLLGPAGNPGSWQRTLIDEVGTHELESADIDGDGKPDLVGGDENADRDVPPRNGGIHWLENVTGEPASPPANVSPPTVSGVVQQGQTLTAATGTWTGTPPLTFSYQWRRCDQAGAGCGDIAGATAQTYLLVAADVGGTIQVRVTATNSIDSSSAVSALTSVVVAGPSGNGNDLYDSFVTDPGCTGCSAVLSASGLEARIQGASDALDTAYGLRDIGGASGLTGRVYTRTVLRLPSGQTLAANVALFQVRATNGSLVYELYLNSSRTIFLYSPAGGLRASAINMSTGIVLPNDGTTTRRVEVSALRNSSVVVRVDGVDRITLSGLTGATSANQDSLRAGIDHYDGSSAASVTAFHSQVNFSTAGWLG